jgi:hypothetical protein
MRRPYGFVTIKPCFAAKGISAGFSRTSRPARTGRDLDAQPKLAVLQALKMHRISIRCRTTAPLSTRHSDLGQVRRGVDIGRQFSIAASAPPECWGVGKHCAIVGRIRRQAGSRYPFRP